MEDEKCNFLSALPFSGSVAVMNGQTLSAMDERMNG
ncbi:Uncharacterized protein BM_BM17639 [Brugia malayi]|uniref:Uncharacterized protein n=1 Tax=Brugia malayi TaxID=6279 RepID=A0A4E9FHR2_BRUMA|nr:Uncharacterized protein BM_BM17639 [Brugia malayi]VIO95996.1 Uncharacterized protein BM_BM17639 [Brugia malayi]